MKTRERAIKTKQAVIDISLRLAKSSDLEHYTDLLQRTYQEAYTDESIGLTADCFSKEIFATERVQAYLCSNLVQNDKQRAWLCFVRGALVGSATIIDHGDEFELRGFYVAPEYQGKGIGKQLFKMVLKFTQGKDIVLDTYVHNRRTLNLYKKWGFKIDKKKGIFYRHWPEWPEGINAKCLYMRFASKSQKQ
ncbi:MAG: Acetyltransferase, GNAT family protein [Candidatus Curtissbacteria bacterium GW2011_GWA1_40_24]|uniref:Acetyltransferase, GNAT family protein n=1 Tax=Candidatus Curtissbacteria bacterium GW2011_GWA1_40_24 TaxID=1618406 RepID=A0A0G0U5P9_9BACT|nr:MAG: Acetyltransferase, GNAT family protein [Candidatus Curtissbacteria bacterium GW2011_GWA1_40_24]